MAADIPDCPKCRTDSNLSYFGGWYYERFDLFSYSRQDNKAVDITLMQAGGQKQEIEPLLDSIDREGSHQGFIVRKPNGGSIVYMTPLETVTEKKSTNSECMVFLAAISLSSMVSFVFGFL